MEDDKRVGEILSLEKENNKILRGIRSSTRWSNFLSTVYYSVIIASIVWSYYYVQPFLDGLIEKAGEVRNSLDNAGGGLDLNEILNKLKGGQ